MSGSLVKYQTYSAEDAEEDRKDLDSSKGGGKMFKLKVGKTKVRFLPYIKPAKSWRRVTKEHFIDVPGVGRVAFVCPQFETKGKRKCKTCAKGEELFQHANELEAEGDMKGAKAARMKAKKLKPKRRVYANAIVREFVGPGGQKERHENEGVKVIAFGPMIEDQLIALRQDEEDGGDFVHPTKGFDIKIARTGEGQNDTDYKVTKSTVCALAEESDQMNDWISKQHNLEKFVIVLSDEDIERKLRGEEVGGEDEDDDKPRNKKKPRRDEEDEDEDTEEDEDEEDRPRKKVKVSAKKKETVEDDVVDAEFEFDEDDDD